MKKVYILLVVISFFIVSGCATYKARYSDDYTGTDRSSSSKEIEKTFYLIGDAGNATASTGSHALNALQGMFKDKKTKGDYLIYLGDNIYEKGYSKENATAEAESKDKMNAQINVARTFDGETIFIPGNHDWYSGLSGLKDQEKYVENALGKNSFLPEKGCPIEKIDITDSIVLLILDTQWYLSKWDDHPTINDNCEIKTRNEFIDELEGELKKNNEKTILLAMHHPAYTYGPHGGGFSADKHLFPLQNKIPLPGIASIINQFRSQGGVSPVDRSNKRYDELMDRLTTLVQGNDRVIMVSGHEHSLQYIEAEGIKQIVSGSGTKNSSAMLGENARFIYGDQGFAVLDVYKDGSSDVNYYAAENGVASLIFSSEVYSATKDYDTSNLPTSFESSTTASTYEEQKTIKGKSYKWFWGDHYRYVYGIDLHVPVVTLDTLYGGLTIDRKGGGHQTRSLRLVDKEGRNFALRGIKKSATRYLQSVVFTDSYVEDYFKETVTEDLVLDFYTAGHPYTSFVIGPLSDAVDIYHTNPVLFYMPKHKALGKYNAEFGDQLYVIEERPDDGFLDIPSFGKPDDIESTTELRKKLRKDEKYQMDEDAFIKARLFDMLIGDWDRHEDQWRWSRFDISEDEKIYRPIPRDRDQAFSNYDGALLDILRILAPTSGQLQKYGSEIKDLKWLNSAGIKLDRTFIQQAGKDDWLEQAKYLQENLTDEVIDIAFLKLPKEVRDDTSEEIKAKLRTRRDDLISVAGRYYDYLSKLVIITGTDKDDLFEITRGNGTTKISISRIKEGERQSPYKERIINSNETREVWIYGLDDDDRFVVNGKGSNPVFIRIIGGQNNDSYAFENGRAIKVHDHKSKPNTVEKKGGASIRFRDDYEINNYDYEKNINRSNSIIPFIGFNPDDGLKLVLSDVYTIKGFKTSPFHQEHTFGAAYFFATDGFNLKYSGEFADVFGNWNLFMSGNFTSENFTRNFFGFGNETENNDDIEELELDFNRVKTAILSGRLGMVKNGEYGSRLVISMAVESVEIEDTPGRFISEFFMDFPETFEPMTFANVDLDYSYESFDNKANPTRGAIFKLKGGVSTNVDDTERTYGYIHPAIEFYNALTKSRNLVLRTMAQGQFNIGNEFEFYQAAVIGSGTGLRGYRTERFSGESALALGADLRFSFPKFKTGLLPMQLGIFGGFDVGRVWIDGEDSDKWHNDVGGGLWLNAVDALSMDLGVFTGEDGLRIVFGFGVSL
jgi:Calcineurin-like phosphoesterase/Omp85 superfamily domain